MTFRTLPLPSPPAFAEPLRACPEPQAILTVGDELAAPHPPVAVPYPSDSRGPLDAVRWFGSIAMAAVEITRGLRPPIQLHRWVTPEVYEKLSAWGGLAARSPHRRPCRPRVRTVRLCEAGESGEAIEAAVVVWDGERCRALAVRAEWRGERLIATALIIG